jgi:hypothetical protein
LPVRPHGLAQSNTARCSAFRYGAPSKRHRTAAEAVGGVDLGPGEAARRQKLEGGIIQRARCDPQNLDG